VFDDRTRPFGAAEGNRGRLNRPGRSLGVRAVGGHLPDFPDSPDGTGRGERWGSLRLRLAERLGPRSRQERSGRL
jgi:hypothetical protein